MNNRTSRSVIWICRWSSGYPRPSIHLQRRISETANYMTINISKSFVRSGRFKKPQKCPWKKEILGGFNKNLIHSRVLSFLLYERTNGFLTFCKNYFPEKFWFLSFGWKTSRPVRVQNSLNYSIWRTSIKLIWSMSLDIHRNSKWNFGQFQSDAK